MRQVISQVSSLGELGILDYYLFFIDKFTRLRDGVINLRSYQIKLVMEVSLVRMKN